MTKTPTNATEALQVLAGFIRSVFRPAPGALPAHVLEALRIEAAEPRKRCPERWGGGPEGSQCKKHEGHDGGHSWEREARTCPHGKSVHDYCAECHWYPLDP